MEQESIQEWINRLEPPADSSSLPKIAPPKPAAPNAARKRKARSSYSLASPPLSYKEGDNDYNMASTPQKRRRLGSFDPDTTPRQGSHSIPSSSASFSASEASSRQSAKAQIMSLRLVDTGIEYETLDEESELPDAAKRLFNTMSEIERGLDIIPEALKQAIFDDQELTPESFEGSRWKYCFKSGDDNLPGRIPSIAQVKHILAMATECEKWKHEEASWNATVHHPLARFIFNDDLGKQCDDFNAIICTTARPHKDFRPVLTSAKLIDICIYAALNQYPELVTAMKAFSSTTPTKSVNHTEFFALQLRPVVITIETKQPSGGEAKEKAQLQMGIWHASHWAFLYTGVRQKLLNQRMAQGLEVPTDGFKAETLRVLSKLGFIPGIYINGHQWYLVISTYEGGRTTFRSEWLFGETKSLMKIYSVIAGVRELTAWGRDIYLPWFKENILTIGQS
ncbi:hypothetical protein V8C34DRAFT_114321 [Trichoderma compactum]